MPTYIVHGFRWPRPLVRIHVILHNLDDAAPEWLMAPDTTQALTQNLAYTYPQIMPHLPSLRFIEQYDPLDERVESKSQPYAYVCDVVEEVKLGVEIDEVRGRGVHNDAWTAMMDLRDKLAPGEKVSWYVVVCGDVERWVPPEDNAGGATRTNGHHQADREKQGWSERRPSNEASRPGTSRSLKKLFGGGSIKKQKSARNLNSSTDGAGDDVPPLPKSPVALRSPPPRPGPNITHVYARLPEAQYK